MKKLSLILLTLFITVSSVYASQHTENKENNSRLCKMFTQKAKVYKLHMRSDHYAEMTLASYEKRAASFCSKQ